MPPRNPCPDCRGSGDEYRITNPDWPNGTEPHRESTGDECSTCGGSGEASP